MQFFSIRDFQIIYELLEGNPSELYRTVLDTVHGAGRTYSS